MTHPILTYPSVIFRLSDGSNQRRTSGDECSCLKVGVQVLFNSLVLYFWCVVFHFCLLIKLCFPNIRKCYCFYPKSYPMRPQKAEGLTKCQYVTSRDENVFAYHSVSAGKETQTNVPDPSCCRCFVTLPHTLCGHLYILWSLAFYTFIVVAQMDWRQKAPKKHYSSEDQP